MESKIEVTLTDENFETEVLKSDKPVLVDFWAQWCAPCHMIAPAVKEIARGYYGKLKVCKLNVDDAASIASRYGIMGIPTLNIFKDGEVVDTIVGVASVNEIKSKIDPFIK